MNQYIIRNNIVWIVAILGAVIVLVTFLFVNRDEVNAGSFPGSAAVLANKGSTNDYASTTQRFLTGQVATQIMGTTTQCSARVITTNGADVRLSFYDGASSLSQFNGHLQISSTTIAYDGEQYGCGMIRAFPLIGGGIASTSVTITESR